MIKNAGFSINYCDHSQFKGIKMINKRNIIGFLLPSVMTVSLGVGVFLYLKGFFDSSTTTFTQEITAAILGTVLLTVVTSLLLQVQSATDERQKKSIGIFEHKLKIYSSFLEALYGKIEDGKLDAKEIRELMGWVTRISLLAGEEASLQLSHFLLQCLFLKKFRWSDLTESEIKKWREWYKETYKKEAGEEDKDFISVGMLVMSLREDLGEFRVSDHNQAVMSSVVVDEIVENIRKSP